MHEEKDEKLDDWIKFRVSKRTKVLFQNLAKSRGETEAELARRIITKAATQGALQDGLDELILVVRQSMKDVLKPTEDRLAAINAKTAIAAATSMYMNTQVIANAGQDAKGIYEESRKKGVRFVQEKQKT